MLACKRFMLTRRCISRISIVLISALLCSCSLVNTGIDQTATSKSDVKMPQDPSDRYYLSEVTTVEVDGYRLGYIVESDEGKTAVCINNNWDNKTFNYMLCSYDEGSSKWNKTIDIDSSNKLLSSFCPIGNGRIVASTYYGFDVYDLDTGTLVSQNEDLFMIINERLPLIYRRDDGFVIVKDDCVYLIGADYSVVSQIPIEEEGELADENTYFTHNGKDYLVLDAVTTMQYYEIDFDRKTIEHVCSSGDLGLNYSSVSRTGGYAVDRYAGIIYELDPSNKTKKEIAYIGNMLIKPTLEPSFDPMWYVFDENDFVILQKHTNAPSEVLFMVPDTESNLSQRTRLSVRGYDAGDDISLTYAAYLYNTSQDKFLINVENYDKDEYGYNNAEEAQESKLKLLKDFTSGKAPDIFYGNSFDYDQMGRSGLVMDMSGFVKNSKTISEDTISKNIYDLYFDEGHCYKLFPGYVMFGLWSSEEYTGNNDNMTLDDMSTSTYSPKIFGDEYACNIADFAIRYPIKRLIKNGEFIDESELQKIIKFAIDNGESPGYSSDYFASADTVDSKETAVYLHYISFANVYHSEQLGMKKGLRFVGFPTLDGSVHVACPEGLVAVSAGTRYPEECMKFIEFMFSDEVQKAMLASNVIPTNKDIFDEALDIAQDHTKLGDDMYYRQFFGDPENSVNYSSEEIASYRKATESVDTIMIMDWGLYNIIAEEVNSYYSQHKDIKDIAHSMRSRIELYIEENYK